jgi:hypothetical protein
MEDLSYPLVKAINHFDNPLKSSLACLTATPKAFLKGWELGYSRNDPRTIAEITDILSLHY